MQHLSAKAAESSRRYYHLVPQLFLERFGDEALMLAGEGALLLTVNAAAASLFECFVQEVPGTFTLDRVVNWLESRYDLSPSDARGQARSTLAFALRHGLVRRAAPGG